MYLKSLACRAGALIISEKPKLSTFTTGSRLRVKKHFKTHIPRYTVKGDHYQILPRTQVPQGFKHFTVTHFNTQVTGCLCLVFVIL